MQITVQPEDSGKRADVYLTGLLPQFSRSTIKKLFEHNRVRLNSGMAKSADKIRGGDILEADMAFAEQEPTQPAIPTLFEDVNVLVLNKPAGILTHAKGALNEEGTVATFIKPKLEKQMDGNRAGIVHRLDRGTSGVIITAKNQESMKSLQKQFSTRKVEKIYLAIVSGTPKESAAIIDAPIARNPARPNSFMVNPNGKAATTAYKVLQTIDKKGRFYSLLEVIPATGRTHQIRVHLAYIDCPIVGDGIYGKADNNGLMLHALSLKLTVPGSLPKKFVSDIPERFKEFLNHE